MNEYLSRVALIFTLLSRHFVSIKFPLRQGREEK